MSKQFHDFASQWGFKHATSTPRYPQSNGKSEATACQVDEEIDSCIPLGEAVLWMKMF